MQTLLVDAPLCAFISCLSYVPFRVLNIALIDHTVPDVSLPLPLAKNVTRSFKLFFVFLRVSEAVHRSRAGQCWCGSSGVRVRRCELCLSVDWAAPAGGCQDGWTDGHCQVRQQRWVACGRHGAWMRDLKNHQISFSTYITNKLVRQ